MGAQAVKQEAWQLATDLMRRALGMLPAQGGLGDGAEVAVWRWLADRYGARRGEARPINPLPGVDLAPKRQRAFLAEVLPRYAAEFNRFATAPASGKPHIFHLNNGYYDAGDAERARPERDDLDESADG